MSVALGLDPASLLEVDGPMYDALERAAAVRWTAADELAALTLELVHAHYRAFLAVHSGKHARLPEPLRVPRPDTPEYAGPTVLAPAAFAMQFGPKGGGS